MDEEDESGRAGPMTVTKPPVMKSRLSKAMAGVFLSWVDMDMYLS